MGIVRNCVQSEPLPVGQVLVANCVFEPAFSFLSARVRLI